MVFSISDEERYNKLAKAIISHYSVPFFANKNILDLGAGLGNISAAFARLGANVLCVDARADNLAHIQKHNPHLKTLQADLENEWPFAGQKFDMVLSLSLIHISHPRLLWQQIV